MLNENLDCSGRTLFSTSSASGTLIIVNLRAIIHNCNCAVRTGAFALLAADAGVLADLASLSSAVCTAAENSNGGASRNHCDNVLRAGLLAEPTTDAALLINVCDSVLHADGTNGTHG